MGGWTLGTIYSFQTGYPFLLGSQNLTFNDFADSGVVLNGVTPSQLQSSVGAYRIPGTTQVSLMNPKYLASATGGGANPQFIPPNTTPGTIGQRVWLYGPHMSFDDLAITKNFAITERVRFKLSTIRCLVPVQRTGARISASKTNSVQTYCQGISER